MKKILEDYYLDYMHQGAHHIYPFYNGFLLLALQLQNTKIIHTQTASKRMQYHRCLSPFNGATQLQPEPFPSALPIPPFIL